MIVLGDRSLEPCLFSTTGGASMHLNGSDRIARLIDALDAADPADATPVEHGARFRVELRGVARRLDLLQRGDGSIHAAMTTRGASRAHMELELRGAHPSGRMPATAWNERSDPGRAAGVARDLGRFLRAQLPGMVASLHRFRMREDDPAATHAAHRRLALVATAIAAEVGHRVECDAPSPIGPFRILPGEIDQAGSSFSFPGDLLTTERAAAWTTRDPMMKVSVEVDAQLMRVDVGPLRGAARPPVDAIDALRAIAELPPT